MHGELFTVADRRRRPPPAHRRRRARPGRPVFARRQVDRIHLRPERPRGDPRHRRRRRRTGQESHRPGHPEDVVRLVARQQVDRVCDVRPQALHDRRRRQEPEGAGVLELRTDRQSGVVAGRQADRLLQDRRLALERHLPDSESAAARRRRSRSTRPARPIPGSRPTARRSTSSAARGTRAARHVRRRSSSACRSRSSPRTRTSAEQRPDGSPGEAGPEMRRPADGPGRYAQDAEDRLGRPEAAHPAGHAGGVGLQLHPGQ